MDLRNTASELVEKIVLFLPTLGTSLAVLVAFFLGATFAGRLVHRLGGRSKLDADIVHLGAQLAKLAIVTFGVVSALGTLGIDVSALVAGLGLTGFALGFALRDVLSNVLSGVMILAFNPFRRNDRITVSGVEGRVAQIDLRYTTLDTEEKKILVPNSAIFTNIVSVAKTHQQELRKDLPT